MEKDKDKAMELTENIQNKNELTYQYAVLSSVINATPDLIFYKDYLNRDGTYIGCNDAFAKFVGKRIEEIIDHNDIELFGEELGTFFRTKDKEMLLENRALTNEEWVTSADGRRVLFSTSKAPFYTKNAQVVGLVGISRDITEHKLAEDALKESQQQLKAIIANEPECVKLIDPKGKLIDMNPAGLNMLEVDTLEEVQASGLTSYILPEWRIPFVALHNKVMQGESGTLVFEIQGFKGTHRWLETHAVPMYDSDRNVTMILGITRDISKRRESEQRLEYMANFDTLTGLPNRAKFDDQLSYMLNLAKRNRWNFSLMFLDIDHFKDINDSLGHNIGDLLLVEFAKRIQSVLREEDTVARLGGDEFILLLPDTNVDGAQQVAQKLLQVVYRPFLIEQHELTISASIGIAIYPTDGSDKETLSKNADTAMYRAKNDGRNGYSFFTAEMQTISSRNLQLSKALHYALSRDELYLVYQPQISLKTGRVIGAEALLRWEHPEIGSISPAEFIPIAENNGLIFSIGEWVLRSVAREIKAWMLKGLSPIVIAVNLSGVQFRHPDLADLILEILQQAGVSPKYIELELTEGVMMNDPNNVLNIMNSLHEQGIRISIDDFGTGYSSLSYLKKSKVYKLKIDQSFVRKISIDPEDKAIVTAIINMARSLNLNTIAEGVETIEQLDYLREQGCDEVQGYYYSEPLLPEQFEAQYAKKADESI